MEELNYGNAKLNLRVMLMKQFNKETTATKMMAYEDCVS